MSPVQSNALRDGNASFSPQCSAQPCNAGLQPAMQRKALLLTDGRERSRKSEVGIHGAGRKGTGINVIKENHDICQMTYGLRPWVIDF